MPNCTTTSLAGESPHRRRSSVGPELRRRFSLAPRQESIDLGDELPHRSHFTPPPASPVATEVTEAVEYREQPERHQHEDIQEEIEEEEEEEIDAQMEVGETAATEEQSSKSEEIQDN